MNYFLASVDTSESPSSTSAHLAYLAELDTDLDTGDMNCTDPCAYAAKSKTYNEDNPSYTMAMSNEQANEWKKAMVLEVKGIRKQKTWDLIDRSKVPRGKPILPGIWAFKLKRLPDGSPLK